MFNGSLDKPWLLIPIFWIPPFSIVPTIMVYISIIAMEAQDRCTTALYIYML
jgi:hypothetical protein